MKLWDITKFIPMSGRFIKEDGTVDNIMDILSSVFNPNGGIDVRVQDQTTEIIDLHLSTIVQSITLTIPLVLNDQSATFNASQSPSLGNILCLKEDDNFYQGEIIGVTDNGGDNYTVDLDTPLDTPYTVNGGCSERSINLAVDGSSTPVIFSVSPKNLNADVEWDITRVMGTILSVNAMDDGKFGSLIKLTKGIVFRVKNGKTKNIFNAKTNGDITSHVYDTAYIPSTQGPNGRYGFRFRRTFGGQSKNGVVSRLKASTVDEFQIIVQDDLSGLETFHAIVQGHITD